MFQETLTVREERLALLMNQFTGEEIYKVIPNLYPLMILDTVIVEAGVKASGYVYLTPDKWFFKCHFPSMPVMPATLLIETMTQVFISILAPEQRYTQPAEYDWKPEDIPRLVQIDGFKLRQALRPDDSIRIDARLLSLKRGIARGKCEAFLLPTSDTDTEVLVTEFEETHVLPNVIAVPHSGRENEKNNS